ncbi:hypothetical protein [Rhizobium phage RHph_N46]|nr:hypothetical protein [Rhizobium phage RHph_N46]
MATLEQLELALQEIEDAKTVLRERIRAFNNLRTEYIQGTALPAEGLFFVGFYADGSNSLTTHIVFTCKDDTVTLAISGAGIAPPDYYVPTPYRSHAEADGAFRDNEEMMDMAASHLLRLKTIEPFVTKYTRVRVPQFLVEKPQIERKDDV